MRNVTITLEEKVADWSRIRAAKDKTSVSRWIGKLLKEKMEEEAEYRNAMNRFLSVTPVPLKKGGKYPARDEIYDR